VLGRTFDTRPDRLPKPPLRRSRVLQVALLHLLQNGRFFLLRRTFCFERLAVCGSSFDQANAPHCSRWLFSRKLTINQGLAKANA
jgi:hypothetical protein